MGNQTSTYSGFSFISDRVSYKSSSRYQLYEPAFKPIGINFVIKSTIPPLYLPWKLYIAINNLTENKSRSLFSIKSVTPDCDLSTQSILIDQEWLVDSTLEFRFIYGRLIDFRLQETVMTLSLPVYIGTRTVKFDENVTFSIETAIEKPFDVQYAIDSGLCLEESDFVQTRKEFVRQTMKTIFKIDMTLKTVPNIAIIGSGGGMRAVVGISGAMTALDKEHILSCSMYTAGVSGSAWYLMKLYENNLDRQLEPAAVNEIIQKNLATPKTIFEIASATMQAYKERNKYKKNRKYFTLADAFGEVIGSLLFEKNDSSQLKWSGQREKLDKGLVPLPLLTVLQVRSEKKIKEHHEWMELSPYQVYLPSYGAGIRMTQFGDEFTNGDGLKRYEELPINFLLGMCGSAYTLVRDARPTGTRLVMACRFIRNRIWFWFAKLDNIFVATVPNFMHCTSMFQKLPEDTVSDVNPTLIYHDNERKGSGRYKCLSKFWSWCLTICKEILESFGNVLNLVLNIAGFEPYFLDTDDKHMITAAKLLLVDAGLAFNSPFPAVLRPSRNVHVILSFDFSDRGKDTACPFKHLLKAEKWARKKRIPFPDIEEKLEKIKKNFQIKNQYEELYVFSSCTGPTVLHFVMVNNSFRTADPKGSFDVLPYYSTFKFCYTEDEFSRFNRLVQHNVHQNIGHVKDAIYEAITRRKTEQMLIRYCNLMSK